MHRRYCAGEYYPIAEPLSESTAKDTHVLVRLFLLIAIVFGIASDGSCDPQMDVAWVNHYNGTGSGLDRIELMTIDASGNVIVTGRSTGSTSGLDIQTIKYSAAGDTLWTARLNGPANGPDYPWGLAVDRLENIIVTGSARVPVKRKRSWVLLAAGG